jgi:hypothetical protein
MGERGNDMTEEQRRILLDCWEGCWTFEDARQAAGIPDEGEAVARRAWDAWTTRFETGE